jgi:hypothetical protein
MWLLINVDDVADVGNNENKRYLLSDHLSVVDKPNSDTVAVMALGIEVNPVTTKGDDEICVEDDGSIWI